MFLGVGFVRREVRDVFRCGVRHCCRRSVFSLTRYSFVLTIFLPISSLFRCVFYPTHCSRMRSLSLLLFSYAFFFPPITFSLPPVAAPYLLSYLFFLSPIRCSRTRSLSCLLFSYTFFLPPVTDNTRLPTSPIG